MAQGIEISDKTTRCDEIVTQIMDRLDETGNYAQAKLFQNRAKKISDVDELIEIGKEYLPINVIKCKG